MKLIDTLRTDVQTVKESSEKITGHISKVITFMKNIDLQAADDDQEEEEEEEVSSFAEDFEDLDDENEEGKKKNAGKRMSLKKSIKATANKKEESELSVSIDDN